LISITTLSRAVHAKFAGDRVAGQDVIMSQTGQDRPSVLRAARERTRAEITRQILDAARRHLATEGASGIAHRDIKPGNLMVRDGELLIDVAFVQVRPSPWRQAVPSAAMLPCVAALPSGWSIGAVDISSGRVSLSLDSDRAGPGAITVTLAATCDTSGAQQIPSDQPGMQRFEHPLSLVPQFSDLRFYTSPGGCITYRFSFAPGASPVLAGDVDSALSFQPRPELVDLVQRTEGLALCGRGAPCPG
jgi:serine/threonine protein kinase